MELTRKEAAKRSAFLKGRMRSAFDALKQSVFQRPAATNVSVLSAAELKSRIEELDTLLGRVLKGNKRNFTQSKRSFLRKLDALRGAM